MNSNIKWPLMIVGVLLIFGVAWYLISPAFNEIVGDDASPITSVVDDSLDKMDEETRKTFDSEIEKMQTFVVDMDESMPVGKRVTGTGPFVERAHEVMGKAILIEGGGSRTLRFEDFETINGPNLHIYLSSDLSSNDFIDLGVIRATKGNVNYEIPEGVDLEKYNKVLVWCVPFNVLFSYAELQ